MSSFVHRVKTFVAAFAAKASVHTAVSHALTAAVAFIFASVASGHSLTVSVLLGAGAVAIRVLVLAGEHAFGVGEGAPAKKKAA